MAAEVTLSRRQIVGAIATAIALPVCAQSAPPVRLGFSIAKTGIFAAAAPSQLNAYELWKDTVNQLGGLSIAGGPRRRIGFVVYDDQSNPTQAAKIYEKLINQDKVDLLLAPWGTSTHFAVVPVLERYKFPMVGNSATSVQLRNLKPGNIWFVGGPVFPDVIGIGLAEMLKQKNIKSVSLLSAVLPMAKETKQALLPALARNGIAVKVNEEYPPDIRDMTPMLAKVKQANADAVIALSYPGDSSIFVRQSKDSDTPGKFQFALIGPGMDFFPKSLGKSADGIVTVGFWTPELNSKARAFDEAYQKRFQERPDYLDSVLTYMSCEVLEQAVAKAGLDKSRLRDAISTGTFDTINGKTRFEGIQESTKTASFLQIQDGVLQRVWPDDPGASAWKPKARW